MHNMHDCHGNRTFDSLLLPFMENKHLPPNATHLQHFLMLARPLSTMSLCQHTAKT